jgi:hypothetical protein
MQHVTVLCLLYFGAASKPGSVRSDADSAVQHIWSQHPWAGVLARLVLAHFVVLASGVISLHCTVCCRM